MNASPRSKFRLYLLRHANAAWPAPGTGDFDRPIDARGQAEARVVALKAYASGYVPAKIVCSPAIRCRQTADIVNDVFGGIKTELEPDLYDGGVDGYLERILSEKESGGLLIVGHNPSIEALAGTLLAELPSEIAFGYPTSAFLAVDLDLPLEAPLSSKAAFVDIITAV